MKVSSSQWPRVQVLSAQTWWEVVPLPPSPKLLLSTLGHTGALQRSTRSEHYTVEWWYRGIFRAC